MQKVTPLTALLLSLENGRGQSRDVPGSALRLSYCGSVFGSRSPIVPWFFAVKRRETGPVCALPRQMNKIFVMTPRPIARFCILKDTIARLGAFVSGIESLPAQVLANRPSFWYHFFCERDCASKAGRSRGRNTLCF